MNCTIYTSADEGLAHWPITRQYLERYAFQTNAKLVVLPKSPRPNPQLALFDAFEDSLSRQRGQFAWIDSDIVIREDAPNLFELPGKLFVCMPKPISRFHPRWGPIAKKWKVPNVYPYPVTAMVLWRRRHVKKIVNWVNEQDFPRRWGDQEILALACYELEQHYAYFPEAWHAMWNHVNLNTSFLHAAGPNRQRKLEKLKRFTEWAPLPDETVDTA